jgi:hypothetical protein
MGSAGQAGLLIALLCGVPAIPACRKDREHLPTPPESEAEAVLDFPAEIHVEDESVNEFIGQVISICTAGDYEAFRLMWSAKEEPFPRDDFHKAWRSVRRVKVLALRKVMDEEKNLMYVARANVELDPDIREPHREVIIMMVREDNQWRMRQPPKHVVQALFGKPAPTSQPGETAADDSTN